MPLDDATRNFITALRRIPMKVALELDPVLVDLPRPDKSLVAMIDASGWSPR